MLFPRCCRDRSITATGDDAVAVVWIVVLRSENPIARCGMFAVGDSDAGWTKVKTKCWRSVQIAKSPAMPATNDCGEHKAELARSYLRLRTPRSTDDDNIYPAPRPRHWAIRFSICSHPP